MSQIRVVYARPNLPAEVRLIESGLTALRGLLDGGYLEMVRLRGYEGGEIHGYVDEEGRLKRLPYNLDVCGISIVGPIVFSKVDEEGEEVGFTDAEEALRLCRFVNRW